MRVLGTTAARHHDRVLATAHAAFVEVRGVEEVPCRERAIAALPSKDWHGVRVFALRCDGPFGRGPHVQWVPECVLWSLIDLRHFLCPFHR